MKPRAHRRGGDRVEVRVDHWTRHSGVQRGEEATRPCRLGDDDDLGNASSTGLLRRREDCLYHVLDELEVRQTREVDDDDLWRWRSISEHAHHTRNLRRGSGTMVRCQRRPLVTTVDVQWVRLFCFDPLQATTQNRDIVVDEYEHRI